MATNSVPVEEAFGAGCERTRVRVGTQPVTPNSGRHHLRRQSSYTNSTHDGRPNGEPDDVTEQKVPPCMVTC